MPQEKAPGKNFFGLAIQAVADWSDRNSGYHYPRAYTGPEPILRQVILMSELFNLPSAPALKWVRDELPKHKLPEGAEGWFAIPRIGSIYVPPFYEPKKGYYAHDLAVQELCKMRAVNIDNWEPLAQGIKTVPRTLAFLNLFLGQQDSDILVIPAQFGRRHRLTSAIKAQEKFAQNEFALDLFSVLCILLAHPGRMAKTENLLQILCAGNIWPDEGNWYVPGVLCSRFDGKLSFFDTLSAMHVKSAGVPTGFII